MRYTWDPKKAASNLEKHPGVSFEEASTVFGDPHALIAPDYDSDERRLRVIGFSGRPRLLFVVVIEIADDEIRIISARRATRGERKSYATQ